MSTGSAGLLGRDAEVADVLEVLTGASGGYVAVADNPPGHAVLVERCADELGIQVVDEFASLKAAFRAGVGELQKHYVMHPNGT